MKTADCLRYVNLFPPPYSEKVSESNKIYNVEMNTVNRDVSFIVLTVYLVLRRGRVAQSV